MARTIASSTYVSRYPPAQSTTYVKATTTAGAGYEADNTTDSTTVLTGTWTNNSWASSITYAPQRFHIDLGTPKIITRIYYENGWTGAAAGCGAKNFTFWGSNITTDFDDTTYANDGTWVQLTTSQSSFDIHTGSDVADPKYISVTNTVSYRYYAFKIADNYAAGAYTSIRRIELQGGVRITSGTRTGSSERDVASARNAVT